MRSALRRSVPESNSLFRRYVEIRLGSFIVALVILLIIHIDRPQQGLARVSQESMIQLQDILEDRPR